MAVSEEDLEQKRKDVEKLRTQILTNQSKAEAAVQAQSREIEAAQLDAEMASLEAQLAVAKEQAKVSNIKGGAADLHDTLRAARDAAGEVTPPGVLVDTNVENPPANTTGATVAVDDGVAVNLPDGSVEIVAPGKQKEGNS